MFQYSQGLPAVGEADTAAETASLLWGMDFWLNFHSYTLT